MFHGTQYVDLQIMTAICVQNKLPELVDSLNEGPVKNLYQHLNKAKRCRNEWIEIEHSMYIVGQPKLFTPTRFEQSVIEKEFGRVAENRKFFRLYTKFMAYSKDYQQVTRRNSYTFRCKSGVYVILFFVQCATDAGYKYGAYAQELCTLQPTHTCSIHINQVSFGGLRVISLDEILEPVVYVQIGEKSFTAQFPNFYERD